MKTTILLTALIPAVLASSCTRIQEKSADELLENEQMRQELFTSILNKPEYTAQFIDSLIKNEESKKMILENDSMIKAMCMSSQMDTLINGDSSIVDHLTKTLIKKIAIDSVACDRTCTQLLETKRVKNFLDSHSSKKQP